MLKVYPSAPYDLAVTHRDELNADLFDLIKMKTSSDCRSGELIQHGLSVAQVGCPKTFGKPLHERVEEVARLLRLVCRIHYGQRFRR